MKKGWSVSASCFVIAVRILVSFEHGHGASLHEPIIAEKNIQSHQVFFEVEPERFPPVSSKYDDVLKFSSILRIGNSSYDKAPKPRREPTVRWIRPISCGALHRRTHACRHTTDWTP